jgi:hypothetical protein
MNRMLIPCLAVALTFAAGCSENEPAKPATIVPWYPETNEAGDLVFAVFEGRIPCADPARVGCDKIKVALVIYHDKESKQLTTYKLARVYVAASPETGCEVVSGSLQVGRGTKLHPDETVYQLDAAAPKEFQNYWLIGDDILFLLDDSLKPMVGTAGWSYVLNRTRPQG